MQICETLYKQDQFSLHTLPSILPNTNLVYFYSFWKANSPLCTLYSLLYVVMMRKPVTTFSWTKVPATFPHKTQPKSLQSARCFFGFHTHLVQCVYHYVLLKFHINWMNNKELIQVCTNIIHKYAWMTESMSSWPVSRSRVCTELLNYIQDCFY